jgi:hypothetical protein
MQPIAYDSPEREEAEADLDAALELTVIRVTQEDRGWFVEHQGRIGPFFSKKTATDLAADWVAALRASGEAAGLLFVEGPARGADAPTRD